jgi:glycosyltransferase involved in cell wall biosynthesis
LFSSSQIEVIPHGLDLTVFRPFERTVARRVLGLPEDGTLVLFGGMSSTRDSNKGYDLLVAALSAMTDRDWLSRTRLLVFGARKDERPEVRLPIPEHHLGYLNDDISLVMAYSAADVMVVPSRMEAFGQTAVEALACGTPVVCFGATGLIDIVDHLNSGYLAYPYDITDLARGILWATQPERRDVLRDRARQKAEQAFSLTTTAARYLDLYQSLCR